MAAQLASGQWKKANKCIHSSTALGYNLKGASTMQMQDFRRNDPL